MEAKKTNKKIYEYWIISIVIPIVLIVLWELASRKGLIKTTILPPPSKIYRAFAKQLSKGTLQKHILVSLKRVLTGYLLGATCGITLGTLMGLSKLVNRSLLFLTEILRPIPIIAWVPVLILWSGIGERSKIIVIAIGSFWAILINVIDGIHNVDRKYIEVSTIFMKSKPEVITKVILPAALPSIFTGLRVGVGAAWISVIGAELIAASSGLGFLISYSRELSQPASMLVGVFTIGIIGWLINVIIRNIEKRLLKWNVNTKR